MEHPESNSEVAFRREIIESQKSQADFLKWKLIAAAGIGSLALTFRGEGGVSGAAGTNLSILLCLIPLICAYVDLISIHVMLRIIVIGTYLRKVKQEGAGDQPFKDYETYLADVRERSRSNPFVFELLALHGSTFVFSGLVILAGYVLPAAAPYQYWFLFSGVLGMVVTGALFSAFDSRAHKIGSTSVLRQKTREEDRELVAASVR